MAQPISASKWLHYCGYPERRDEPTLCEIPREYGYDTTTHAADVTCPKCRSILGLEH